LRLSDPDPEFERPAPPGGWPILRCSLVQVIRGLYGKEWIEIKAADPLEPGFDPTGLLPKALAEMPKDRLLLAPQSGMVTIEEPPDFIRRTILEGRVCPVMVAVIPPGAEVPSILTFEEARKFDDLCNGDLQLIEKA
jgi:hypothetical protein